MAESVGKIGPQSICALREDPGDQPHQMIAEKEPQELMRQISGQVC